MTANPSRCNIVLFYDWFPDLSLIGLSGAVKPVEEEEELMRNSDLINEIMNYKNIICRAASSCARVSYKKGGQRNLLYNELHVTV